MPRRGGQLRETRSQPRRWDLTADERRTIEAARGGRVGAGEVLRTVLAFPSLAVPLLRSALAGAAGAVRDHGALAFLIDARRVRRVVPDAAIGVQWHGEDFFVGVLTRHTNPDARALEIGCGTGRITRRIAPHVRALVAGDISREMLSEARANLGGFPNVEFAETRGFTLSEFPDESFDLVFSHDVLTQFQPNQALAMLDSAHRVLRPGGVCVASFVTVDRPAWAGRHLERVRQAARSGRFGATMTCPYTSDQLAILFRTAGFDLVEAQHASLDDAADPAHFVVVGRA
jgi:SAM-dependent methyltransferase